MNTLAKKLFAKNYVETYLLIFIPLAGIASWNIWDPHLDSFALNSSNNTFLYFVLFGWGYLTTAMVFLYFYIGVRVIILFARKLHAFLMRERPSRSQPRYSRKKIFISSLYITSAVALSLLFNIALTDRAYTSSPDRVAHATETIMQLDKTVFGSYVPFTMQSAPHPIWLTNTLLWAYVNMSVVLSFVMILALFTSTRIFRQFLIGFLIIPMISAPVWFFFPALTPGEMYRDHKLNTPIDPAISAYVESNLIKMDPKVSTFLDLISPYESKPEKGLYSVTTFPSMHVAWGTLILYIGALINPLLLIVLLPWWVMNLWGAIYTLQHFAIDTVAGVLVCVFAIIITRALMRLENRHRLGTSQDLLVAVDALREDARSLTSFARHAIRREQLKKFIGEIKKNLS